MVLVASYTGEGRHLGGIIRIPWLVSEAGLGVHFFFFLFLFSLVRAPMPLFAFVESQGPDWKFPLVHF